MLRRYHKINCLPCLLRKIHSHLTEAKAQLAELKNRSSPCLRDQPVLTLAILEKPMNRLLSAQWYVVGLRVGDIVGELVLVGLGVGEDDGSSVGAGVGMCFVGAVVGIATFVGEDVGPIEGARVGSFVEVGLVVGEAVAHMVANLTVLAINDTLV